MRFIFLLLMTLFSTALTANAVELTAIIDKSDQMMRVYIDGLMTHQWLVSTGKNDGWTQTGTFYVQSMSANHFSSLYNNAPMPWSVFFNGNIATHGTTMVSELGKMASHGCVRLHPDNAQILFELIEQIGQRNTIIIVQN